MDRLARVSCAKDRASHWVRLSLSLIVALVAAIAVLAGPAQAAAYEWDKPITWAKEAGPEAREHGSVIVDEGADRVIMIGGSGYAPYLTPLADVWQLSLKTDTWTRLAAVGTIPSGGSRRVVQIPGQKTAYLYGGYLAESKTHGELVRVDYSNKTPVFTTIPQDNPPSGRGLHAFAYDPRLKMFILFGGVTVGNESAEIHNDVWTMRLVRGRAQWKREDIAGPPSPRYGSLYGYDPAKHQLIVFSGAQAGSDVDPAQDTWVLSFAGKSAGWKKLAAPSPSGRRNGAFVYDPAAGKLLIFGGTKDSHSSEPDLWEFDAAAPEGQWTVDRLPNGPALRSSSFGFVDRKRRRILIGFGNGAEPYPDLYPLRY